jgi:phosphatidylglycerol lysyltransferase
MSTQKTLVKEEQLRHYLKLHGSSCMSYSTLQSELRHFVLDGIGYIAYLPFKHLFWSLKGHRIVIGNPVCAPEHYQTILEAFFKETNKAIFVHISESLGEVLTSLDYQVNGFGIETDLLCNDFELGGKARAKLRQWRNKCEREGVTVVEKPIDSFEDQAVVRAISQAWLDDKGTREYGILSRPFSYEAEEDVRNFWAYQDGKLIAMAVFDPIYKSGKVIGYYHNVDRILPSAPNGCGAFMILEAMKVFQQEDKALISLGMSPLFMIQSSPKHNKNQKTQRILKYTYKNLNYIYPFQGNASHKQKFAGRQKQVYISSTEGNNLWEVLVLLKSLGALEINLDTLKIFGHIVRKSMTLVKKQ